MWLNGGETSETQKGDFEMKRRKQLDRTPEWKALKAHAALWKGRSLRNLFAEDPKRAETFSLDACGWHLDYSKNLVDAETMDLLQALCTMADLRGNIDAMFSGERINATENRPVLHVALRNRSNTPILVRGKDVMPGVNAVLEKMGRFCDEVRSGRWLLYHPWFNHQVRKKSGRRPAHLLADQDADRRGWC